MSAQEVRATGNDVIFDFFNIDVFNIDFFSQGGASKVLDGYHLTLGSSTLISSTLTT